MMMEKTSLFMKKMFLLGKYKVWSQLEIIHCIDSAEAILDSDGQFVGFIVKNITYVTHSMAQINFQK